MGSTVTIQIPTGPASPQDGLQVPISAIFDAGKGPGVWLIGGEPAKVSWRPVVIRQLGDDRARITGQLRPGDQVVALGAHLLSEGQRVRVGVKTASIEAQGARP